MDSTGAFDSRTPSNAWNYFHINSVDKDDEGNYLVSARSYSAIFKIDGVSGKIIWQLGGRNGSSFNIPEGLHFAWQHDARFLSRSADGDIEIISFFDNAAHSRPGLAINPFSRARIVRLQHSTGTASQIRTFPAPDNLSTHSQGNVQVFPNGNVFVNWGQAGAVSEFSPEGKVLFHAYLDSDGSGRFVESYRGFRFNWTGHATEEPAITALERVGKNGKAVTVYVSWNGDTETVAWRFYTDAGSATGTKQFLGEVKRSTFETEFVLGSSASSSHIATSGFAIFAEAINARGIIIVTTKPAIVRHDVTFQAAPHLFDAQFEL